MVWPPANKLQEAPQDDPLSMERRPDDQTCVLPPSWDVARTCSVLLDRNEVLRYGEKFSQRKPVANKIDSLLHNSLKKQPETKSAARPFRCYKCGNGYKSKGYLSVHIKRKHTAGNKKLFKCEICDKRYVAQCLLNYHVKNSHLNTEKYMCDNCKKQYQQKQSLIAHLKYCGNKINYTALRPECKTCGKTFGEPYSLAKHIAGVHKGERNHSCTFCDLRFFLLRDLNRHISTIHSIGKFICNICNKKFGRKDHLNGHLKRMHKTDKNIKGNIKLETHYTETACKQCGKVFYHNGSLQRHISKVHKHEKRHKCTQCDKGFLYLYLLRNHVAAKHRKEKHFKCVKCIKMFLYKSDLYRHMNKIHNIKYKGHNCSFCDKKFHTVKRLNYHKICMHNIYICEYCHKKLAGKKSLYKHVKNEHIFSYLKSETVESEDGQNVLTNVVDNGQISVKVEGMFEDDIEIKEETLEDYIEEFETGEESALIGCLDSSPSPQSVCQQSLQSSFLQSDLQIKSEVE